MKRIEMSWEGSWERTRTREREIVYLALLVTVHWQAFSSHALDFPMQPHQRDE